MDPERGSSSRKKRSLAKGEDVENRAGETSGNKRPSLYQRSSKGPHRGAGRTEKRGK